MATQVRRCTSLAHFMRNAMRRWGKCQWCNKVLRKPSRYRQDDPNAATVDHLRPRSRGGTDHWSNLCLACFACNQLRGSEIATQAKYGPLWSLELPAEQDVHDDPVMRSYRGPYLAWMKRPGDDAWKLAKRGTYRECVIHTRSSRLPEDYEWQVLPDGHEPS